MEIVLSEGSGLVASFAAVLCRDTVPLLVSPPLTSGAARRRARGAAGIYLDSSALMKLIRMEDETAALRDWLGERPRSWSWSMTSSNRVTSRSGTSTGVRIIAVA